MIQLLRNLKKLLRKLLIIPGQVYYSIAGSKVECNVCNYKTNKFHSDSWHLYSSCPNCFSSIRQRLLIASLTFLDQFNFEKIIKAKKVLHFAPEKFVGKLIKKHSQDYKTADLMMEGYSYDSIDFNIDISDMKSISNESYDCVIACDVLEHVPDHLKGIKEVFRILKQGGYCIFTVPQKDHLKITFEDLSIKDKKERERLFGQFDHLRIYGDDFSGMMAKAGFDMTEIDHNHFDKTAAERFVLFPPVLSTNPLATNYRKVFFGRKA